MQQELRNQYQDFREQKISEGLLPEETLPNLRILLAYTVAQYVIDAKLIPNKQSLSRLGAIWYTTAALPEGPELVLETCLAQTELQTGRALEVLLPWFETLDFAQHIQGTDETGTKNRVKNFASIAGHLWADEDDETVPLELKNRLMEQARSLLIDHDQKEQWLISARYLFSSTRNIKRNRDWRATSMQDALDFGPMSEETFALVERCDKEDLTTALAEPDRKNHLLQLIEEVYPKVSIARIARILPVHDANALWVILKLFKEEQQRIISWIKSSRSEAYVFSTVELHKQVAHLLELNIGVVPTTEQLITNAYLFQLLDELVRPLGPASSKKDAWIQAQVLFDQIARLARPEVLEQALQEVAATRGDKIEMKQKSAGLFRLLLRVYPEWLKEIVQDQGRVLPRWVQLLDFDTDLLKEVYADLYHGDSKEFMDAAYVPYGGGMSHLSDVIPWEAYIEEAGRIDSAKLVVLKKQWDTFKGQLDRGFGSEVPDVKFLNELLVLYSPDSAVNSAINEFLYEVAHDLLVNAATTVDVVQTLVDLDFNFPKLLIHEEMTFVLGRLNVRRPRLERAYCDQAMRERQPEWIVEAVSQNLLQGQGGKVEALKRLLSLPVESRRSLEPQIVELIQSWWQSGGIRTLKEYRRKSEAESLSFSLGEDWYAIVDLLNASNYWSEKLRQGKLDVKGCVSMQKALS